MAGSSLVGPRGPRTGPWRTVTPPRRSGSYTWGKGEIGLTDPFADHRTRPITEHLKDFEQALRDKSTGKDSGYIRQTVQRIRRMLDLAGIKTIEDLSLDRVRRTLGKLKEEGLVANTRNSHLTSVSTFANWLVKIKRLAVSPLAGEKRAPVDKERVHVRRALTLDQFSRLVQVANVGALVRGVLGPQRALIYTLAAYTGFRASTLASLRPVDFDFEAKTVDVTANEWKGGRDHGVPLRRDVIVLVERYIQANGVGLRDRLFPRFDSDNSAVCIRADLAVAGIPYQDERGRYADFHSLRGLFNTRMAVAGVSRADRRALMGVSSERLVTQTYCYEPSAEHRAAMEKLPPAPVIDFSSGKDGSV